ncbi:hypothetical protein TVAG_157530 [Trichomonas vaginalis G3]|uniref:Initiator binding domain-containing protein n=1 Tax=Trichomonas vaginalis (strain ATCC PRA-98 / G3) TaxID=412133 RepID=A2E9M5_TRIV3|nr:hypothetical protein TVAGG3_0746170 [Trichomonas vaginalis G3]EAY10676.1 hypothetical protein TVAG_157530 [Trichomonas vaginalis G3]KAI5512182.1 hypothetical protein TVAGG3_0746170 [Trichomonas vaginalis G3]|eukprot:XP_001322899.1 hypothetical protein [Trichomonas vaginalis G3]
MGDKQLIDELDKTLSNKKSNRLSVPGKLLYAMKFTTAHPELREIIGIYWLDDYTFMVNNSIASKHLDIKTSSMNKNFSDFGFIAISDIDRSVTPSTVSTPLDAGFSSSSKKVETSNVVWTKRTHRRQRLFNKNIEPEMCIVAKDVKYSEIIDEFLREDPVKYECFTLLDKLGKNYIEYVEPVIIEWKNLKQELGAYGNEIELEKFTDCLARNAKSNYPHNVSIALSRFIQKSICSSVVIPNITFLDYVRLCLRFGPPERIVENVEALLKPHRDEFEDWFSATVETTNIRDYPYIKMSSSHPCYFSLVKPPSERITIAYNPLSPQNQSFNCEGFEAGSLKEILAHLNIKVGDNSMNPSFSSYYPESSMPDANDLSSYLPF